MSGAHHPGPDCVPGPAVEAGSPPTLLYLHGFRSSPQSFKARLLAQAMADRGLAGHFLCPQLPVSPRDAIAALQESIAEIPSERLVLIGSSLGGYYARWLAEQHGCRAVLLNPATRPADDLERHLGEQPLWHGGGAITVEPRHLDELRALQVPEISDAQRYFLVACTGDEVLDYRDMLAAFSGARLRLINGGDHGISDFAQYMPEILEFCGISRAVAD